MVELLRTRSIVILALLAGTSACSVTDYRQPINQFAAATKDAETAISTLNSNVTKVRDEQLREQAVGGELRVQEVPGDCLASSDQCRLQLLSRDRTTQPLTPPPLMANMVALMQSITAYANNLVALVSADTAAAVAANVNATLGSVGNLAMTIDKPVDLAHYETPVGEAAAWIVGQYTASVKVDGLRRATSDAQPVIAEATKVFETAAATAAMIPRTTLAEQVRDARNAFDADRSQANLEQLVDRANQLNQLLEAKPSDVFDKMNAAHQALTNELQGGPVTLTEAFAKIQLFAAEARKLAQIAKAFAAAANSES